MRARLARLVPAGHEIAQAAGSLIISAGVYVVLGLGAALIVAGLAVLLYGIAGERG